VVPVPVPLLLPVPLFPLLPEVPLLAEVPEPEPLLPDPLLLGLTTAPPEGERTEPEPLQAANDTTDAKIRLARRVCLRTLPEDMLRIIITPRTLCVPPVVDA
jgi:hypothetical protein